MDGTSLHCMVSKDGSIEIPPEALAAMGANLSTPLCLGLEGDAIVIRAVEAACEVCGADCDLLEVNGYYFCGPCARDVASALDRLSPHHPMW